jgi:hypothetical protein
MARKGTEPGGPAETKAAKFSRLASARVTRAVKAINRVGSTNMQVPSDIPSASGANRIRVSNGGNHAVVPYDKCHRRRIRAAAQDGLVLYAPQGVGPLIRCGSAPHR